MTTLLYYLVGTGIFVGVLCFVYWLTGNAPGQRRKMGPFSPQEEDAVKQATKKATQKYNNANRALDKSAEYIRQIDKEISSCERQIDLLKAKIEKALGDNQETTARQIITTLQFEEADLSQLQTKLAEAKKLHEFYQASVATEWKALQTISREADSLQVRLELAKADTDYRNSTEALASDGTLEAMRAKVQNAEIMSQYSRPKDEEDEFMDAGKIASIDERLNEFKRKMSQ